MNRIDSFIFSSKEKVFRRVKHRHIKKFNQLNKANNTNNDDKELKKKWVVNLSTKPLTPAEESLLKHGPKYAVASKKIPTMDYMAATQTICDSLGENSEKLDCSAYYSKAKDLLQKYNKLPRPKNNITREEKDALNALRKDESRVILTADKGVALVVMDKAEYTTKCLALLSDTTVYKKIQDETKQVHSKVCDALLVLKKKDPTGRLYDWCKSIHPRIRPPGTTSPPARFYGLPKIHKANTPVRPIVSACGTSTYQLAKFLTRILKNYCGKTTTFVRDSKHLVQLFEQIPLEPDDELVSFDVKALFTSIPVPAAVEVIRERLTQHQAERPTKYTANTFGLLL